MNQKSAACFNPLYLDMVESCVILANQDDFLKHRLAKTREQMQRWMSQKHQIGNTWYWDIRPGTQFGEVIDYDK